MVLVQPVPGSRVSAEEQDMQSLAEEVWTMGAVAAVLPIGMKADDSFGVKGEA